MQQTTTMRIIKYCQKIVQMRWLDIEVQGLDLDLIGQFDLYDLIQSVLMSLRYHFEFQFDHCFNQY